MKITAWEGKFLFVNNKKRDIKRLGQKQIMSGLWYTPVLAEDKQDCGCTKSEAGVLRCVTNLGKEFRHCAVGSQVHSEMPVIRTTRAFKSSGGKFNFFYLNAGSIHFDARVTVDRHLVDRLL